MTELTQSSWDIMRSEYERGRPASRLCEHYGVARSTFYGRARAEGWRKPGSPPIDLYEIDSPPEPAPTHELARRALAHAAQAMELGRLAEAERWSRLVRRLRDLAMEEHRAGEWVTAVQRGEEKTQALGDVQPVDTSPAVEEDLSLCLDEEIPNPPDTPDCPEEADESGPAPRHYAAMRARLGTVASSKGLAEPDWDLLTDEDIRNALGDGWWEEDP